MCVKKSLCLVRVHVLVWSVYLLRHSVMLTGCGWCSVLSSHITPNVQNASPSRSFALAGAVLELLLLQVSRHLLPRLLPKYHPFWSLSLYCFISLPLFSLNLQINRSIDHLFLSSPLEPLSVMMETFFCISAAR